MKPLALLCTACVLWVAGGCSSTQVAFWDSEKPAATGEAVRFESIAAAVQSALEASPDAAGLTVTYPYDGAVFPPEIAAPVFSWQDSASGVFSWLVTFAFENGRGPIYARVDAPMYEPAKPIWETVKRHSVDRPVQMRVIGMGGAGGQEVISQGAVNFTTSLDPVGASVFYRQVPLPFSADSLRRMRWRLGDIASYDPPPVVMKNIPVCASCHVFSADGKKFSMEMNYGNDGGAQFIAPVQRQVRLTRDDFMSWNDYPRPGVLPKSRGLFGKMSPSGKYIVASVNEISLALITNEPGFSQVFFPTYGILAWYSAAEGGIRSLPGADDFEYVHANPNWSPDDSYIVFARAPKKNEVHEDITRVAPRVVDAGIHALNNRYNIQFDLYRIPFKHGRGGVAEPVRGAAGNRMSNYFPRVSPDGKWIVFTQSRTGIMLQPDSRLFIVAAEGGRAREMTCNRELFNSWHSWSPNSRWLLFSSKVNTPFTEIFVTHVDENGNDSPPVLLQRFSDSQLAANVPEFVNAAPDAIQKITLK